MIMVNWSWLGQNIKNNYLITGILCQENPQILKHTLLFQITNDMSKAIYKLKNKGQKQVVPKWLVLYERAKHILNILIAFVLKISSKSWGLGVNWFARKQ